MPKRDKILIHGWFWFYEYTQTNSRIGKMSTNPKGLLHIGYCKKIVHIYYNQHSDRFRSSENFTCSVHCTFISSHLALSIEYCRTHYSQQRDIFCWSSLLLRLLLLFTIRFRIANVKYDEMNFHRGNSIHKKLYRDR